MGERDDMKTAYAKGSLAWKHGDKTEDELLQRIWNLAGDVVALAVRLADAEKEANALRAERDELRRWKDEDLTRARAERDEAQAALATFGVHPDTCAIWVELDDVTGLVHPIGTCSCGLAAALASVPGGAGT